MEIPADDVLTVTPHDETMARERLFPVFMGSHVTRDDWEAIDNKDSVKAAKASVSYRIMNSIQRRADRPKLNLDYVRRYVVVAVKRVF